MHRPPADCVTKPPADCLRVTRWAAWVAAGRDKAERAARLALVPEVMRASVRQEVVWWFDRSSARVDSSGQAM